MSEKKNIDRLFQEKFKDFEVSPPDFVWENLQSRLEEKKKRRVIPLWFKLSGVAAILVVGIFVLAPYLTGDDNNSNQVVIEANKTNPDGSPRITPTDNPVGPGQSIDGQVVASEENTNNKSASTSDTDKGALNSKTLVPATQRNNYDNDAVASSDNNSNSAKQTNKQQKNKKAGIRVKYTPAVESAVVQNQTHNSNTGRKHTTGTTPGRNINKTAQNPGINNGLQKTVVPVTIEQGVANNTNDRNNTNGTGNSTTNSSGNDLQNKVIVPKDITPAEAVAGNDTPVDSTDITAPENELEKLLRKKLNGEEEEELIADNSDGEKWNIKPQMAPLFFNTASSGSPIDANLAANSKDFDNDLSYGVGLNYALTDRLSIRSGINTVNMKYSTNDIEFYASLDAQPASAVVTPGGTNASLVISPAGSTEAATDNFRSEPLTGSLVQKIGFVEVPLEMSYKLVNKRFGIDVIGGVSTLFLSNNNVSLISDLGLRSNMGEANNINSVSFSTNVGVGFKYRIFDALEASFEPMFKYQLNTFSNNSGNFKPYFIGLYSGISFSF